MFFKNNPVILIILRKTYLLLFYPRKKWASEAPGMHIDTAHMRTANSMLIIMTLLDFPTIPARLNKATQVIYIDIALVHGRCLILDDNIKQCLAHDIVSSIVYVHSNIHIVSNAYECPWWFIDSSLIVHDTSTAVSVPDPFSSFRMATVDAHFPQPGECTRQLGSAATCHWSALTPGIEAERHQNCSCCSC